jgi:hypothetical protein
MSVVMWLTRSSGGTWQLNVLQRGMKKPFSFPARLIRPVPLAPFGGEYEWIPQKGEAGLKRMIFGGVTNRAEKTQAATEFNARNSLCVCSPRSPLPRGWRGGVLRLGGTVWAFRQLRKMLDQEAENSQVILKMDVVGASLSR